MSDTDVKPEDQKDGGESTSAETSADAEIIEAEIVDEPAPPSSASSTISDGPASKPKASFMSKAGWILAFGCAAFIGGVALAPRFDVGLVSLGLKDAPAAPTGVNGASTTEVDALRAEIADVKASLRRQQEMLAQHEASLKAGDDARTALRKDIDTLASAERPAQQAAAPSADPQEIAALQSKVSSLSDDIARLSALANSTDPAVKDLSGAIAIARAENTQLKNRLSALESAMQAVKSGAVDASPRGRLILALGRLKDRALTGLPFGQDLAALRPDFATLPALDQQRIGADLAVLEDHGSGVRSFDGLLADYDAVATAAVKAEDKASGNFLTGLFTMRRTDAGATGLDATLAKAERALRARDVAGTVKLLETVTGPAAEPLKPWLDAAKAHIAVDAAFSRLSLTVAREDSPAGSPAPATVPTTTNEGASS